MALPSTIYRAAIELSDVDRGVYETLQATVARHPSEIEERLVVRLLAYALFYEPELAFTKGISAADEPDLWLKGADGRVLQWIEVGLPESDRIIKAARHADHVVLVACGKGLSVWEQQHLAKLLALPNLTLLTLDQHLIRNLVASVERSINWQITINEGSLYINSGGETFEAPLLVKVGKR